MKKLGRILRTFLNLNKIDTSAKKIVGDSNYLYDITTATFNNMELANIIKRDVISLIVFNNFTADLVKMLNYFKHNYNFTINEFVILSYKVGMLSKIYIDNPIFLLSDAIAMPEVFTEQEIHQLSVMLEVQKRNNDLNFQQQIKNFNDYQNSVKIIKTENDLANEQIDKWLSKNKKR